MSSFKVIHAIMPYNDRFSNRFRFPLQQALRLFAAGGSPAGGADQRQINAVLAAMETHCI